MMRQSDRDMRQNWGAVGGGLGGLGESHEDGSFTAHKAVMRGGKGGDE